MMLDRRVRAGVIARGRRRWPARRAVAIVGAVLVLWGSSCGSGGRDRGAPTRSTTSDEATPSTGSSTSTSTGSPPTTSESPSTSGSVTTAAGPPSSTTAGGPVEIVVRLERRVADPATADFAAVVQATLTDSRGWQRAGFVFRFAADAPYTVVLAEGDVVHELCRPYDVGRRFSCQNGPTVALNADRWRTATSEWTGDLAGYRQMLVNHEVGHLLGQHHPEVKCPDVGEPAPVMTQQSTELNGCVANPWPLAWEVACAARRLEPIAPGYEPDPKPLCGPAG